MITKKQREIGERMIQEATARATAKDQFYESLKSITITAGESGVCAHDIVDVHIMSLMAITMGAKLDPKEIAQRYLDLCEKAAKARDRGEIEGVGKPHE